MTLRLAALPLLLLFATAPLRAQAPTTVDVAAARSLFADFEAREATFDPALADLYCDTAMIVDKRTRADGGVEERTIAATRYKALIREALPEARAGGSRSEYRDVVFVAVDGGVRITATRHSLPGNNQTPIQWRVGDCAGRPAIVEELSQSHE